MDFVDIMDVDANPTESALPSPRATARQASQIQVNQTKSDQIQVKNESTGKNYRKQALPRPLRPSRHAGGADGAARHPYQLVIAAIVELILA
jgi:hypothetical protein